MSGESKISKKWGDPKIQICLKLSKIKNQMTLNIWFVEKPNIIISWKINKRSSFSYSESENTSYCWQGLAAGELGRKYSRLPITVFKSSVLYYYTRVHWPGGKWCEKKDWVGLALHSLLAKRKDYDVIFVVELLSKVSILWIISRFCFSKKFGYLFGLLWLLEKLPKCWFIFLVL